MSNGHHRPNRSLTPGDEFERRIRDRRLERRRTVCAFAFAAILHAGLFLVTLPELTAQVADDKPARPVVELRDVRLLPSSPPPPSRIKPRTSKTKRPKIPVPEIAPESSAPPMQELKLQLDLPTLGTDLFAVAAPTPPAPEPGPGPIQVSGDVTPPRPISTPQPQYPRSALLARITGQVIVEAVIEKNGQVTEVKILKSLPMGLGEATADAIQTWRFEPATLNGRPVAVFYRLTVNFDLN